MKKRVFISVGEISGDNYASEIIKLLPEYEWIGITGPKMRQAGCKSIEGIENISVVGITEAISKYFHIKNTFKKAVEELKNNIDLLIVVDFPGFNLKLLEEAKKLNIKTVYFISPQIWAWGYKRIHKIVKYTDILISILPFEESYYKDFLNQDFKYIYVGHPLLDIVKYQETEESFKEKLNIDKDKILIGLLAGSRENEIKNLLPIILDSAKILNQKYKNLHFIIPATANMIDKVLEKVKNYQDLPLSVITNIKNEKIPYFPYASYEVMKHSKFSIITSGTATLEAAIIGNPFIIIYKVSPITYFIGKMLVSIKYIGLPNIIAGKEIIKELIQNDCNTENIVKYTEKYITDENLYQETKKELKEVRNKLGEKGALQKTAKIIKNILEERK